MKRIKRSNFISAFNRAKRSRKLSTAQVARNSSLSRSYVYHVVSPRYKMDITPSTARKVGKGLRLNPRQITIWIHSMMTSQRSNQSAKAVSTRHSAHWQGTHHHDKNVNPRNNRQPHRQRSMTSYQKKLIQIVRNLMSTKGISTQKLAGRSGLNEQRVSNYIHGKVASIPKFTVVRIARGLGVNPAKLLNVGNARSQSKTSIYHKSSAEEAKSDEFQKRSVPVHHRPVRRSVRQVMQDINKLNDADIAIVDLIVNRISEAEHRDKN